MSTHNKNAATEDQMGVLHNAITKVFNKKLDAVLQTIEENEGPDAALCVGDPKLLAAAAKWVLDNGVTCIPAADTEGSDLSKKIAKLKEASQGKVIQFTKEA